MEIYIPDMYKKNIHVVDYKKLKESGIKCLLFDLDNTIVPYSVKRPTEKVKKLFKSLQDQGFKVVIFSNSGKKRLAPFKEELNVDCCPRAFKPSPRKFLSVMKELNFNESEVAILGDQMLTDIIGGNRVGITTVLTNPITNKDMVLTYYNRHREKKLIKKLSKAGLFYKGKYYD